MKKSLIVVFVCLGLLHGGILKDDVQDGRVYWGNVYTPLSYLLTDEENFPFGSTSNLEGYISLEEAEVFLYFSKYDYLYQNRENAVLLMQSQWIDKRLERFNETWEIWQGRFVGISLLNGNVFPISDIEKSGRGNGCASYLGGEYALYAMPRDNVHIDIPLSEKKTVSLFDADLGTWKESFIHGEGESLEEAIPVSLYRYMWDNAPYRGKYVEVCGRIYQSCDRYYAETIRTDMMPLCKWATESYMINLPLSEIGFAYRDAVVLVRAKITDHWVDSPVRTKDDPIAFECHVQLQPKRGKMEE